MENTGSLSGNLHSSIILSILVTFLAGCGGGGSVGSGGTSPTPPTPPSTHNMWTWITGADSDSRIPSSWTGPGIGPYNSDPWYGTLGVAAVGNTPGGRNSGAYATDSSGNFWLFGGDGLDGNVDPVEGYLNDLWKFNPSTNEWEWVSGNSSSVVPGCEPSAPLTCGQSGVYGTIGVASSSNMPGGRASALTLADSKGNIWLFGGFGFDSTGNGPITLNDLWKFDPKTKQWTWISGSSTASFSGGGVYGTQGVEAPGNVPPSALETAGWIDSSDNIWIFGGETFNGSDFVNNLWKFNPQTSEWTWVTGAGPIQPGGGDTGDYGTLGTPAPGNTPGSRFGATTWIDSSGNLWLFGGFGTGQGVQLPVDLYSNDLNDLWEFNPATGLWAWMGGSPTGTPNVYGVLAPQHGSFGTQGTASATNVPSGRDGASGAVDSSGNFWLFGGKGVDSQGTMGSLNDLWKFDPKTKDWTWVSGSSIVTGDFGAGGVYGTEGEPAASNVPGARYNSHAWADKSGNIWVFAGDGILYENIGGATVLNDLWRYEP